MAIKLDAEGNIVVNETTGLSEQVYGKELLEQGAISECRCEMGQNFADPNYGRDSLTWKLSQSNIDRVADIKRIVRKYYEPNSITITANNIITVS